MNGAPSQSGPGQNTNGAPRPRPKPKVNPLVSTRRKIKPNQTTSISHTKANLLAAPAQIPSVATTNAAASRNNTFAQRPPSPEPPGHLTRIPVFSTKRALLEGLRHHVARLQSKAAVDITDQAAFTRPVRLHRKDPAARPEAEPVEPDPEAAIKDELDQKERERVEAVKAENKRIREENQKQIAPSLAQQKKKPNSRKQKTQQVFRPNDTAEEQKKSQLRYEEAYPWHIEDDDNKQTWMGSFEQTLSDCHLVFIREQNAVRVIPAEKFYRFKEKGRTKQLDVDTVNEMMTRKTKEPKFIMLKKMEKEKQKNQEAQSSQARFAKKGSAVFAGAKPSRNRPTLKDEDDEGLFGNADLVEGAEEVDFEHDDLFDDDDGDMLIQGDDEGEVKEQMDKIKKEQLGANIFDLNDEAEVDEEEAQEAKRLEYQKNAAKKIRKALLKREKNYNYERDSDDENPYSETSDDDDTSVDGEADEKSPDKDKNKNAQNPPTKGDTTPSGRKKNPDGTPKITIKKSDDVEMSEASGNESSRLKKNRVASSLKRPGSPDVSGASGNESSRKKQKVGSSTLPNRQVSSLRAGAGSGSESEGSRGKLGRTVSNSKATPAGSRAQSPIARSSTPTLFPTKEEVVAAIGTSGVSMDQLMKLFKGRMKQTAERIPEFVKLVRSVAKIDGDKWVTLRPGQMPVKSSGGSTPSSQNAAKPSTTASKDVRS